MAKRKASDVAPTDDSTNRRSSRRKTANQVSMKEESEEEEEVINGPVSKVKSKAKKAPRKKVGNKEAVGDDEAIKGDEEEKKEKAAKKEVKNKVCKVILFIPWAVVLLLPVPNSTEMCSRYSFHVSRGHAISVTHEISQPSLLPLRY